MLKFIPPKGSSQVPSKRIIDRFTGIGFTKDFLDTILITSSGERPSGLGPYADIDEYSWYDTATTIFWLSYNQKYEKFKRGLEVNEQIKLIREGNFNALISPIYKYNVNTRGHFLC